MLGVYRYVFNFPQVSHKRRDKSKKFLKVIQYIYPCHDSLNIQSLFSHIKMSRNVCVSGEFNSKAFDEFIPTLALVLVTGPTPASLKEI